VLRLGLMRESSGVQGKGTRTVSRMARECYAQMPLMRPLDCAVEVLGNPVRRAFREPVAKQDARRALGLLPSLPTLLVVGGSQGAQAINDAAIEFAQSVAGLGESFQVLHLTGHTDVERARTAWRESGVRHRVAAFTHNTATWLAAADLALTRAGAGTISECLTVGVPMILVPYPSAADDHQRANAQWVAGGGAGVVVPQTDLSAARIRELVNNLLLSSQALSAAANAAAQLAQPSAAERILDAVLVEIGVSAPTGFSDSKRRAA